MALQVGVYRFEEEILLHETIPGLNFFFSPDMVCSFFHGVRSSWTGKILG
jgi:hypothetical protein